MAQEKVNKEIKTFVETPIRKRGRPKWVKQKVNAFTIDWALRGMKSWQRLYLKEADKSVTGRIANLWLSWTFKTERVVLFHIHSHETEEGVLVTKI